MKRILVTGAGGSAGHNFIDSLRLSNNKYFIVATDINKYHIELLDNADVRYIIPPCSKTKEYIDAINKIIEIENIDLVHPQPDSEVYIISENRDKINSKIFLPNKETISICQNKVQCNEILHDAGVPVPKSAPLKNVEDLRNSFTKISSQKYWIRAIRGAGSKASLPVINFEQAIMWIDYWNKMRDFVIQDFMISEFLPGKEYAFQSVWNHGKLVTSQARERMEYVFGNLTPSGQSSSPSVAKTVSRDDVNSIATDAILAIDNNASGVFCVDMKENSEGIPCITEINTGRFFTTSNFFSNAGCNMPDLYVKLALDEEIAPQKKYNPIPVDYHWIRMIDMGYKLVRNGKWTSKKM